MASCQVCKNIVKECECAGNDYIDFYEHDRKADMAERRAGFEL